MGFRAKQGGGHLGGVSATAYLTPDPPPCSSLTSSIFHPPPHSCCPGHTAGTHPLPSLAFYLEPLYPLHPSLASGEYPC